MNGNIVPVTGRKTCTKCGMEKDISCFGVDRQSRDGLFHWCRACQKEYDHMAYIDPNHPAHVSKVACGNKANKLRLLPAHLYTWVHREKNWRVSKTLCLPGCLSNKGYLCSGHYQALWTLQDGRCALCGGLFFPDQRPYPAADHYHALPDGTGPVRGLLHGGVTGCNVKTLGGYERGRRGSSSDDACAAYLADPPATQLARKLGLPVAPAYSAPPQAINTLDALT